MTHNSMVNGVSTDSVDVTMAPRPGSGDHGLAGSEATATVLHPFGPHCHGTKQSDNPQGA